VADSHFYYGLLLYSDNQDEKAYEEIKTAFALGRKVKDENEALYVANHFADGGYFAEAIEIFKKGIEISRDENVTLELRLKLGVAYFLSGEHTSSRALFEEVLRTFNLSANPSYHEFEPILRELGIVR